VRVPKYLFKFVYDEDVNRAWAYWHENSNDTKASPTISYQELVEKTGINFLPNGDLNRSKK
jgi:endonuclease G